MINDRTSISTAINIRSRYMRRLSERRSAGDRLSDFAKLQEVSFRVLRESPCGYRHFLSRNLRSRRVEVIDGQWQPVSSARPKREPASD